MEYFMACQGKRSFRDTLFIFVESSDRIRKASPTFTTSIARLESSESETPRYKLGHDVFCYIKGPSDTRNALMQPDKTVLCHFNISQRTTITRDLSDETETQQRYRIKEILFCSLDLVVLYSQGIEKKKIRVFIVRNGQLHRSGNIQLPPQEEHPVVLLHGDSLLVCTFNCRHGWNLSTWNLATYKRTGSKRFGLENCLPHNLGRHFCFSVFRGNFYVLHTKQPSEPLPIRLPQIDYTYHLHEGLMSRAQEWGRGPRGPPLIEEDFYKVGSIPITFVADMEWGKIQRWCKNEYTDGTVPFNEYTELWLESDPMNGDILIIESRLEAISSGKKRVFFQQPVNGSRTKSEIECRKGASYAYVPRAATFLEVLNNGMNSLTLRSSTSSCTIFPDQIHSEYTIAASNDRSLILKGKDSSFLLVSFDPSIAL